MVDGGEPEHATSAQSGSRAIGYAVAGAAILLAIVTIAAALASIDSGGGGDGAVPSAARAAGCKLESFRARSNLHIGGPDEPVRYSSDPPTSGRHHPVPADDGAYAISPDIRRIVHTLEHGRVAIWFDSDLPREARASLKAFYLDDPHHVLLVPDTTGMPYAVAATAWNRDPGRYGTGCLLGCRDYGDDLFTALAAFRDRHRDRGPELVP